MRRLIPFLLVLFTASTAHAGKVIVLAVNGDTKGELEDGLTAIVEDRHDIVTSGQAERVARRAGLDDLDGPSLGKLAKKLAPTRSSRARSRPRTRATCSSSASAARTARPSRRSR
jgi:hypothetical protein